MNFVFLSDVSFAVSLSPRILAFITEFTVKFHSVVMFMKKG